MNIQEILDAIVESFGPTEAHAVDKTKVIKALTPRPSQIKQYLMESPSASNLFLRKYIKDLERTRKFVSKLPQSELEDLNQFLVEPPAFNPNQSLTKWYARYAINSMPPIHTEMLLRPLPETSHIFGEGPIEALVHELGHHKTLPWLIDMGSRLYLTRDDFLGRTPTRGIVELIADLKGRELVNKYMPDQQLSDFLASPGSLGKLPIRYPIITDPSMSQIVKYLQDKASSNQLTNEAMSDALKAAFDLLYRR